MSNIVVEMFDASGMTIAEFARRADLKYSTAHDIVTGKANIENVGIGAFVRIARVFNTTADALMDDICKEEVDEAETLTDDERELLHAMRSMSTEGQRQLMIYARGLLATYPKNNTLSQVS